MSLLIDDDARMLRETAGRFFAGTDSLGRLRRMRDANDLEGAARGQWDGIVAMGLSGVLAPDAFGGSGLGLGAAIQVSEMMGRSLAGGPFLSSAVMAVTALSQGDNAALKAEIIPWIVGGGIVALAAEETARHAPHTIAATAERAGDRYRITGRKIAVIDGNVAGKFIVVARDAATQGLLALMVDVASAGIAIDGAMGLDATPLVAVAFEAVAADQADLICAPDRTADLLDRVYDAGRIHLAAEMLGAAQEAFDRTLDYLKTRVQFGRRIGEFQALQHRAAILFGELEIARSAVLGAAAAYDAGGEARAARASLAKARMGEIALHVAAEAVQMHGGIGVTDDFDLGLFLKRIRVAAEQLGDTSFHAERYARLHGL